MLFCQLSEGGLELRRRYLENKGSGGLRGDSLTEKGTKASVAWSADGTRTGFVTLEELELSISLRMRSIRVRLCIDRRQVYEKRARPGCAVGQH